MMITVFDGLSAHIAYAQPPMVKTIQKGSVSFVVQVTWPDADDSDADGDGIIFHK